MDKKKKKRRRGFHLGVLILGIYLLIMGVGTMVGELGAIILLGERGFIVTARALLGAVFTVLGVYAVWDAIKDLLRPKDQEKSVSAPQFIFTDASGARSSHVTPEMIREQIGRISEKTWRVSLQPAEPLPAAEQGMLISLACLLLEDGMFLLAVFRREDGGTQVLRDPAEPVEAEAAMTALLEGNVPDVSGWEPMEAAPRQPGFQPKHRLVLFRDNGRSDHEFFSDRDLDLAVTGLKEGTYNKIFVQTGPVFVEASPLENGDVYLYLQFQGPEGARAWQRTGTPNQTRFWLLQFYDGSLFQSPLEGWEPATPS